jgi:hypothetical protein
LIPYNIKRKNCGKQKLVRKKIKILMFIFSMDNLGIDLLFNPKKRKKENKNKDQNKNYQIINDLINNLDDKDIIDKIINLDMKIDPGLEEEITKDMLVSLIKFIKLINLKKNKQDKKKTKKTSVESINVNVNVNNSEVKKINLDKSNSKKGLEKFFSISKAT